MPVNDWELLTRHHVSTKNTGTMLSQIMKSVSLQNYNKNTYSFYICFYICFMYLYILILYILIRTIEELLKVKFPAVNAASLSQRCLKAVIHVLKMLWEKLTQCTDRLIREEKRMYLIGYLALICVKPCNSLLYNQKKKKIIWLDWNQRGVWPESTDTHTYTQTHTHAAQKASELPKTLSG